MNVKRPLPASRERPFTTLKFRAVCAAHPLTDAVIAGLARLTAVER
jgi:hypothetical protein